MPKKKPKQYVEINAGMNQDTGFNEFTVHRRIRTGEGEWDFDDRNEKYFIIRPSTDGHLVVMAFDREADSSHIPQLQPEIIQTYHRPQDARKRLEKECRLYARKLMQEQRLSLNTDTGFKNLEDLGSI